MTQQDRIPYLDWLRCLAVLLVVIGHGKPGYVMGGAVGVSVFFVLSGYLITSILLRDGMLSPANLLKFVFRRIARIYPMLVVQVFCILAFYAFLDPEQLGTAQDAAWNYLTFRYDAPWLGFGFGVLWSLVVEFWFYVTFPFLFWIAVRLKVVWPTIALGIAISFAAKYAGYGRGVTVCYDQFLFGSICALAIADGKIKRWIWKYALPASVFGILLLAQIRFPGAWNAQWYAQTTAVAILTCTAILGGHFHPPSVNLLAARYIGRISYSLYLMHAVVFDLFVYADWYHRAFPFFLTASIMVASLTFYLIERPAERLVHRYVRYGKGRSPSVAPI